MPPFTVKCATKGCDARYTRHDCADKMEFGKQLDTEGWESTLHGHYCPSCQAPSEQEQNPILAIPISCGTFYAECPVGMTARDWRAVADCVERVAQVKTGGSE